jgi:hypothetical protein
MSIKMRVEGQKVKYARTYPYIGVYRDVFVLFTGITTGIALSGSDYGQYHTKWIESEFDVYDKPIILENVPE